MVPLGTRRGLSKSPPYRRTEVQGGGDKRRKYTPQTFWFSSSLRFSQVGKSATCRAALFTCIAGHPLSQMRTWRHGFNVNSLETRNAQTERTNNNNGRSNPRLASTKWTPAFAYAICQFAKQTRTPRGQGKEWESWLFQGGSPRKEPTMYACVWMEGGVCGQKAIPSHYSNFRCIPSFELRDPAMILAGGKLSSYKGPRDCWPHFPLPGSGVRVNYEMKQSSLVRDMEN